MLRKIVSGGQTGADQGGIKAGRKLGLETGGWAPPNYETDEGPKPKLLKSYGLKPVESDPKVYVKRTMLNVKDSDGTIWFGQTSSPGGRLTIGTCIKLDKPYVTNPEFNQFVLWLKENNIEVLNVAGNRESQNIGIEVKVFNYLKSAITHYQNMLNTKHVRIKLFEEAPGPKFIRSRTFTVDVDFDKLVLAIEKFVKRLKYKK